MHRLSILLLSATLLAAQPPARVRPGYDLIQPARLKADLTFLSSDAMEGRKSLERGSETAIQWIAAEFAKAGLAPAARDSYLQPVPIIEYSPDPVLTTLTVMADGKTQSFHGPDITASFANEVAGAGGLVFAGYGITAPELHYDDYAGIDAKGKVALIFNHEPQEDDPKSVFNGKGNTRYNNNNYKAMNAARHGAIALLSMPDPNHRGPQRTFRTPGAAVGAPLRPRILPEALGEGGPPIPLFNLRPAVVDAIFATAGKKPADLQTAIEDNTAPASFAFQNVRVDFRTGTDTRRRALSYNVAGILPGSDPALRAETIIISGHFDHDGIAPAGILHGADDNGSGTVGVVALAHAFAANPEKPRRSILFIVFAAEERGLLGSYYYAGHPLRPLDTTRAHINFDMIGRNEAADPRVITDISPDTSNQVGLVGTHYSPDYRETVERQNKIVGLDLTYKWDQDSYNGVLFRSDQYPLLQHDIPAIWWFTGFHPDYHQVTDTVDKINFEKMTKILRLAYLSAFEFGDQQNPPRFKP